VIARPEYLNLGIDHSEVIVPRRYPVEFRRKVLDLIEARTPVAEIAAQLGVSDQTICNWRSQDRIDRGLRAVISTSESAERTAARKRIGELETASAVTKRANQLLTAQCDPKALGDRRPDRERGASRSPAALSVYLFRASSCGASASPRRARRDARRGHPRGARWIASDLRRPSGARPSWCSAAAWPSPAAPWSW
jgi:transposase